MQPSLVHRPRKWPFPGLREQCFVRMHRGRGHKVLHFGKKPASAARCYWRCSCKARYSC